MRVLRKDGHPLYKILCVCCLLAVLLVAMRQFKLPGRGRFDGVARSVIEPSPCSRQELRHRTHETENARTYTFVDGFVRKVEIRFADGAVGYRYLDRTTSDGKPKLSACEEIHEDKTRYSFELGDDGFPVVTIAYDKNGLMVYKETYAAGKLKRVFLGKDGLTVLATLELLKDGGYTYVACEGSAGSERTVYEEQYREYQEDEEGGSTRVTTYTVFDGARTPRYRQVWLRDQQSASTDGTLERLEFFSDGGAQVAQRITFAQDGTVAVRVLDKDDNVTAIRNLSAEGRLVSIVTDPTKTPPVTFVMPSDTGISEAIEQVHRRKPGTEAMHKLLFDALSSGAGYHHLDRLLVD